MHVRNIEKFHPGYKDRKLIWAKIFFDMVQGDPDCEMIENEVDWSRLIKFIVLELQAQAPIPIDKKFLERKGFDFKKRKIELTLQALQKFVEVRNETVTCNKTVTEPLRSCNVEEEVEKEEEEERYAVTESVTANPFADFEKSALAAWNNLCESFPVLSKVKEISGDRRSRLKKRYEKESFRQFSQIIEAIKKQRFLRGENDRNWKISFDWLLKNDTNYLKVLELRYLEESKDSSNKLMDEFLKREKENAIHNG